MRILALDLATKTGWALIRPGWDKPESGVQDFSLKRGESPGMRFLRFRKWLMDMRMHSPELYVYEQPHYRGGAPTQVCVGLESILLEEVARVSANHVSVHSKTLKKFATGKGNASKAMMERAANKRWNTVVIDDNHADALMILAWAMEEFSFTM